MTKNLMRVSYTDFGKGVSLTNYADTVVVDERNGHTLCAIRFGGYPEQVEAMASAIYGGGNIYVELDDKTLTLKTLAKQYRKKVSHDGVYAEATLIAQDDFQKSKAAKNEEGSDESENLEPAETADLPPRNAFIYVRPGDREALFDAVDEKTAVPLIPEFADYILAELESRGILRPLKVLSISQKLEAWILRCESGDANIISVVEDGLRDGKISIPGANSDTPVPEVNSVTEYLTKYGTAIAERINSLFDPLFDPAKDEISPEILEINSYIQKQAGYSLYDAQLAVAESIKRQLANHKIGLVIAECGSGKTKIGLTAIAGALAGKKQKTFNIVLCPSHITKKWVREIEESLPSTFAGIIGSITDFDRLYQKYDKGDKSCFAVISKETARDGYMRAPAVIFSKFKQAFVCPDCGENIEMPIMEGGSRYMVNADQFFFKRENRQNHSCVHCGSSLWTALNPSLPTHDWVKSSVHGFYYRPQASDKIRGALRKYPLSAYIKRRYKGRIDSLIIDEMHQYNNNSGQGDAMNDLYSAAKKAVGMTATLINGYSSGIFHLLYRIMPGLMQKDGKEFRKPNDFIGEYGVIETSYEETAKDYNSNRRTVKGRRRTRQRPGVSPLVYSRFLLEYAAFLTLSDMGKDLPEYEEIPVALSLPDKIADEYRRIENALKEVLNKDAKAAQKILSAYLNLLTAYPDQPYGHQPIYHPFANYAIVEPQDLGDIDTAMPKDEKLLEIVRLKIAAGEKVLIYTNWTRLDTQKKLKKLLTDEGYRTEILPATVATTKREQWVEDRLASGLQVLITNPSLVETGLDLNSFTTLIFYDIGYKLFTLRQASRRSWRINQTAPRVEVYLLYYASTMQHKALRLMATKLAVAGIIEGGFSEEGLAAMSQCEDMTTLMAKELMLGIKDNVEDVSAAFKKMAILKPQEEQMEEFEFIEFTFVPQKPRPVLAGRISWDDAQIEEIGQLSLFDLIA